MIQLLILTMIFLHYQPYQKYYVENFKNMDYNY